jgi:O-methyltransferase involved in polyketide biosynthesis
MNQDKVKVNLSGVSETLLGPLWARAKVSREHSSLFYDANAVELVEKIDYDFSMFDMISFGDFLPLLFVARARQFDKKVRAYITEHPRASVVNIGAGLDATFYRVDNGTIHWYDLDLPAVIEIRKRLIPEPDRVTYIAKSLFDTSWCRDVSTEGGVFMIAGGLFRYFEEAQVKQFFSMLADNFPGGEIIFNASSGKESHFRMWIEQLLPDQQKELEAALMETLKCRWEAASQDQKDTLTSLFKIPTSLHGTVWADIKAWWDLLSDKEKGGAMRDFISGLMRSPRWGTRLSKWALKDANEITRWDNRITVIDQFPLFKDIPRDPSLSLAIREFMDFSDKNRTSNIFHLRV